MSHNPDRPDRVLAAFAWLVGAAAVIAATLVFLLLFPYLLTYAPSVWITVASEVGAGLDAPSVPVTAMQALASTIGLGAVAMALHIRAMGAGWLALKHGASARGALPLTPMAAAVFAISWGTCLLILMTGAGDLAAGLVASGFHRVYLSVDGGSGVLAVALLGSLLLPGLAWALEHRPFVVVDGLAALRPFRKARSSAAQKQN